MPLSELTLRQKARLQTGIELDDIDVREPLWVLVDSLNREGQLTPAGERAMEERLIRLLANRLRMERDFIAYPEIANEQIVAPIFIYGLPRSGTTKMQKLLSATGDFTELPFWMAFNPSLISGKRDEEVDARIEDAEHYVKWLDSNSPDAKLIHQVSAFEPEEVSPILEQAFHNFYWSAFVNVPSYNSWEAAQDPRNSVRYLQRTLQYLQWQFAIDKTKPWALKNPLFVGLEPVILNVFPDAKLLMTHRHPEICVASAISLQSTFHKLCSDIDITSPAMDVTSSTGFLLLESMAAAMAQNEINRSIFPGLGVVDVSYSQLTQTSLAVVEKIYHHIGKPLSDDARCRVDEWETNNRQHKHGVHKYSLGEFRLSGEMVTQRFKDYIRDYQRYF
jgi:hypothetical protein